VRDLEAYLTDPLSRCGGVCGWAEFGQVACRLFGPVRRSLCPALSELPLHSRSANEGPIYRHRHNLGDCVGMAAGLSRSYLRHVLASPVGKRKRKGLDRDLFILRLACIWRRKRKVAVCIYGMRSRIGRLAGFNLSRVTMDWHCIVWEHMAWRIRVLMSVTKCTASKEIQNQFTIHNSLHTPQYSSHTPHPAGQN